MNNSFPFNTETYLENKSHEAVVQHLSHLVERACRSESNKFGYSVWKNHILMVVHYAKLLAQQMHADEKVCEIAALLHDYAGILDATLYEQHHIHSATLAHELLKKLEYPKDKIEHIKHCIISHRATKNIPRKTREAEILASADAIAHIFAWESLLELALEQYQYPEEEAKVWVSKKIQRSFNKVMPEALSLVEEKYKLAQLALQPSHIIVSS